MTAIGTTHSVASEPATRPQPRLHSFLRWTAALVALLAGVFLPTKLYAAHDLPVIVLVSAISIAVDRILGTLGQAVKGKAARRAPSPAMPGPAGPRALSPGSSMPVQLEQPGLPVPSYSSAGPGMPQTPPAPPPLPGPHEPQHSGPDMAPAPPSSVRPLVFVGRSQLGAQPWRLPRRTKALHGVAADEALAGDLDIRATSVIGPAHRFDPKADGHRQDTYQLGLSADGRFLIAAVADGVSNATQSHDGARLAATTAVELLRIELARNDDLRRLKTGHVFTAVAHRMASRAEHRKIDAADFAATLIVAVVPTAPGPRSGQRTAWLGWVADSSGWSLEANRWHRMTGMAKSGYDPNTLDECLPADPHLAKSALITLGAGQALALMTDGLSDLLTDVMGAAEELAKRWAAPPSLPAFVRDMCFDAPGQDDDRTAVVIWTPGAPGGPR